MENGENRIGHEPAGDVGDEVREFVLSWLPKLEPDDILTTSEVGRMLKMNSNAVGKWATEGRLPHFRTLGGHRRIYFGDLVDALVAINTDE